ncbi:response regulator [candidate division FCPU426 bacterium]|nr:response regulator [candidate division FCPU426 bacterium]
MMADTEKTLLIVDDQEGIRTALHFLLEDSGYIVITAEDGREAVKIIQKQPVDLVITDILMPEMDGLELITFLRKYNPNLPCIAISAGDPNFLKVGQYLGADRILEKPFSKDQLKNLITDLLVCEPR